MKQRWLIKPLPASELTPALELDPATRDELITWMATAIEFVCLSQANLNQETNGALIDERTTTTSQDQP